MDSGIYDGEPYDCEQTCIRGNHLAIVDVARAGETAQIKLDSAEAELVESVESDKSKPKKEAMMPKVNLDGIDYEAAPEVINALTKAQAALAETTKIVDKVRADADTLKAENETLKKRDIAAEVKAGVLARLALERNAAICLDGEDVSSSSDAEIKAKVVAKAFPEIKLDGKSADYVDACFDNAVTMIVKNDEGAAMREQRKASGGESINNDGKDGDPRAAYIDRLVNGYRTDKK
jgi:hypothetical protein